MGTYVPDLEMPCCCLECPFLLPLQEITVDLGLYKKISHCCFADPEIEDPWRDTIWLLDNKEEWCPLVSINLKEKGEEK